MDCSEAREALSARADGEAAAADPLEVARHVAGCRDCTAFAAMLGVVGELVEEARDAPAPGSPAGPTGPVAGPRGSATSGRPMPDLAPAVLARLRRRRESRVFVLRWGVGLMGGAELANALYTFIAHGGQEVHATHESLSFTVAICLGLLLAAHRPPVAASYLPVIGTAVGLLLATATLDVSSGRVAALDELPHVDLLVGFVLLWLLAREQPGGPRLPAWGLPRRPAPATYGGLRAVPRAALRQTLRQTLRQGPVRRRRALAVGAAAAGVVAAGLVGPAPSHAVPSGASRTGAAAPAACAPSGRGDSRAETPVERAPSHRPAESPGPERGWKGRGDDSGGDERGDGRLDGG